jgi:hypothetical protein
LSSKLIPELVIDHPGDAAVYGEHIVDGGGRSARKGSQEGEQTGLLRTDGEPGGEIVAESLGIVKGKVLKAGIEEEIEGIDGLEVGDEVNLDVEFRRGIRKERIGLLILVRIEPPLDQAGGGEA